MARGHIWGRTLSTDLNQTPESKLLPAKSDVLTALASVVESDTFRRSPRARRLLRYLVEADLDETKGVLTAYAVGVDALERPEDFDPSSDSSVRVAMNRLRELLDRHYGSLEGKDAEIKIHFPKGTFQPRIVVAVREESVRTKTTPTKDHKRPFFIGMVASLSVVGALSAVFWFGQPSSSPPNIQIEAAVADLIVQRIDTDTGERTLALASGVLRQLIHDLESTSFIRVIDRTMSDDVPSMSDESAEAHRLQTFLSADAESLIFVLTDAAGTTLWAETYLLPNTDVEYARFLRSTSGAIATEIAGDTGALITDFLTRMASRLDDESNGLLEEYDCLVLSFAADASKVEDLVVAAQECLSRLVAEGSTNASIFAQAALFEFLSWAGSTSTNTSDAAYVLSLELARRATQLDPRNALGWEHLGSILSARGDRGEAIAAYETGLAISPWKPSLHFLLGWQLVLTGEWDQGMARVRIGVEMTPNPPGYMQIPLALDAFRIGDFATSLEIARQVQESGDRRGHILGFVAALALGDLVVANDIRASADAAQAIDWGDPLGEVSRSFSNPDVLANYQQILSSTIGN